MNHEANTNHDDPLQDFVKIGEKHPLTPKDLFSLERVGDPKVSNCGKWVAFTRKQLTNFPEGNEAKTNLWLISVDGQIQRQLTNSPPKTHNHSPEFSPDGKSIAFISNRSGKQQIWILPLDGGEATQLTDISVDVETFHWSPQGNLIAFTARIYTDGVTGFHETEARDKELASKPRVYDSLYLRHWDEWVDEKRSHLFVVPVSLSSDPGDEEEPGFPKRWRTTGPPKDLMAGVDGNCPLPPFGGSEQYAWHPSGSEIAYVTQIGKSEVSWSTNTRIYRVPVTGGPATPIPDRPGFSLDPVYSPDGKSIAFLSMEHDGFESDKKTVFIYFLEEDKAYPVTKSWPHSAISITWHPTAQTIFITAEENGRQKIFTIGVEKVKTEEATPAVLVNTHKNQSVVIDRAGDGLVFLQSSVAAPPEVFRLSLKGGEVKKLTHINRNRLNNHRLAQLEEFYFTGSEGRKVHGFLYKPFNFQEGKKFPVAFLIHGGPQGAWLDDFSFRWNPQIYSAAGYAVITINFVGSTGYGQDFTNGIRANWTNGPFEDLMKGLDYCLENYKWMDGDNVAALGASYGGFMINWINGQTNRFKCLVNHDGLFDQRSFYFTTEELYFPEWEMKGPYFKNSEQYEKSSPVHFVEKWQTPTLVIHGSLDYRVPITEGIATFTALQRRKIPSKFVHFPDENHWVLKPTNALFWFNEILGWLAKFTTQPTDK